MSPSYIPPKSKGQSLSSDQALLAPDSDPVVTELSSTELYAWGVDYSSYDLHLGAVPHQRHFAACWTSAGAPPRSQLADRYATLYRATIRIVEAVVPKWPPLAVAVEEPNRSREVIMAHGVILAALHNTLRERFRHPVAIWTVNTTTWRHAVLKPPLDPGADLKQQAIAHVANTFDYKTTDHNYADAICIADWLDRSLKEEP